MSIFLGAKKDLIFNFFFSIFSIFFFQASSNFWVIFHTMHKIVIKDKHFITFCQGVKIFDG